MWNFGRNIDRLYRKKQVDREAQEEKISKIFSSFLQLQT